MDCPPSEKYPVGIRALVIIGLSVLSWVLVIMAIEWVMD